MGRSLPAHRRGSVSSCGRELGKEVGRVEDGRGSLGLWFDARRRARTRYRMLQASVSTHSSKAFLTPPCQSSRFLRLYVVPGEHSLTLSQIAVYALCSS